MSSRNGKGSAQRPTNRLRYARGWDRVYGSRIRADLTRDGEDRRRPQKWYDAWARRYIDSRDWSGLTVTEFVTEHGGLDLGRFRATVIRIENGKRKRRAV